jgi:hypothetical protein
MADQSVFIYALFDPRDPDQVRYVGQTSRTVEYRLYEHERSAKRQIQWPVSQWIRKLHDQGVRPAFKVLQVVAPGEDWGRMEKEWIASMRCRFGKKLLNVCDGGEGTIGVRHSKETLARMSEAAKRRGNHGGVNKGRMFSAEARAAMSAAHKGKPGRKWTAEQRKTASDSAKARPPVSQEHRELLRRAQLNSNYEPTPEHRAKLSEATRRAWERRRQERARG